MKLKTKFSLQIMLTITLLTLYHFFIHNGLEKTFSQTYFDYPDIRRPLRMCDKEANCTELYCTGMPSGHAETSSVFAFLLYFYKMIPLWLAIIFILLISVQRVLANKHTVLQIIVGSILGFLYATIYRRLNLSMYGFLTVFTIGFILTILSIYKIDQKVYGPIPSWVDKSMVESIKKKQDSPFYIKVGSIYINAVIQKRTFISWSQLEQYLDIIVDRIRNSGVNYDAVIGIKTGGAIIYDYISLKLGLPNYKVKLSRKEYNCNKQPKDAIDNMIKNNLFHTKAEYMICEGVNDNDSLQGKNVILIDELVSTGKTMEETYKYLKDVKHVNQIYPTTISLFKLKYKGQLHIDHVLDGTILIWPWGYDN